MPKIETVRSSLRLPLSHPLAFSPAPGASATARNPRGFKARVALRAARAGLGRGVSLGLRPAVRAASLGRAVGRAVDAGWSRIAQQEYSP